MEYVWYIMVVLVSGSIGFIAHRMILLRLDANRMERQVKSWIDEYRSRLTGSNRFVISEELLAKAFPEYDREVIAEVWSRMIEKRIVDRDPMDQEMCIK